MKITNLLIFIMLYVFSQFIQAATPQATVNAYIQWLRTIKPEKDYRIVDQIDRKRVAQWVVFRGKRNLYYPLLKRRLQQELKQKKPSQMMLLDFGFNFSADLNLSLLSKKSVTPKETELIDSTFRKINHNDPLIRSYIKTYFWFIFSHSNSRPKNLLPLLDKVLLPNKYNAYKMYYPKDKNNPHYRNTYFPIRVHSFGLYGEKSMTYLLAQLKPGMNPARQEAVLSILRYVCTEVCAPKVYDQIKNGGSHDSLVHGVYVLLDTAGPLGIKLVKKLDSRKYKGDSAKYLETEQNYARQVSYKALRRYFTKLLGRKFYGSIATTPEQLEEVLKEMEAQPSKFLNTHPHAFLSPEFDERKIITHLLEVRRVLFLYIKDQQRIMHINRVINLLRFKRAWRVSRNATDLGNEGS